MRAFEIHLNGRKLCLAGIEQGILGITVNWVARTRQSAEIGGIAVGGLVSPTERRVEWMNRKLHFGDELRIKIVEVDAADKPPQRRNKGRA